MEGLLINVVFGHFVGDFFLQHTLMAENKFLPGRISALWCTLHVLVYTATVALFAGIYAPIFILGVAVPHWVADRWSFACQWMKLLGRGDLIGHHNPSKASFGAVIYVVIDQTYHIGCLYVLLKLM